MLFAASSSNDFWLWAFLGFMAIGWACEKAVSSPTVQKGAASWLFGKFR